LGSESDRVALLVHGTWAPESPWTLPDSPLCRTLRNAHFVPRVFEWTGKNSVRARAAASDELAAELRSIYDAAPDCEIVVISHSHGGNVALRAINDSGVRTAGLVAMSTPFLQADERRPHFAWQAIKGVYVTVWVLTLAYIFLRHPPLWLAGLLSIVVPSYRPSVGWQCDDGQS
jgi:pimeloyl-ACP methyl ester carboxylesterase